MSRAQATLRSGLLAVAFCAIAPPSLARAQAMDPNMPMDMPMPAAAPKKVASPRPSVTTPIPALTDADRAAARAPAGGHAMDASRVHSYALFDQLEAWDASPGRGLAWRGQAWIGGDIQRLWLRSEGERVGGDTERAELEILYGRAISPWWTVLAGLRHDLDPGSARDRAAIGIMGTAPYKFEVAATAYLGGQSGAALRLEGEYDVLLTNRLVLQPHLELNASARGDQAHGLGAGLDTVEAGLRVRYQFSQRVAPYLGVVREQAFGDTADLRRAAGSAASDTRVVAGLRFWF